MDGSLSVRFDAVLGDEERGLFEHRVTSRHVHLASWATHKASGRTYARLAFEGASPMEAIAALFPDAHLREPALCVLAVTVGDPAAYARVCDALAGPGAPSGIVDTRPYAGGVVCELDDTRTGLALVVELIDLEARGAAHRIEPLAGVRDETLAAFCAAVLATPQIDRARIVETYTEAIA